MRKVILASGIAIAVMLTTVVAEAQTVTSGYDAGATLFGGVRYRAFPASAEQEVFEGVPSLLGTPTKATQSLTWTATQLFTFTYTPGAGPYGTLYSTVGSNLTLPYAFASSNQPLPPLNYVHITLNNPLATALNPNHVKISDLKLNGTTLGTGSFDNTSGTSNWRVDGIDLSTGFTLTGSIDWTPGTKVSNESPKAEFAFGRSAPVPEPAFFQMGALLGMSGLGFLKLRRKA